MPTKTCKACLIEKDVEGFYTTGNAIRRSICKPCQRAYNIERHKKVTDVQRHRDRQSTNNYRTKLREKAIQVLGGKCARCPVDDFRCLQIDHVNGGGTKERSRIGPLAIYRKIIRGASGYQLLCANCNWIKRFDEKEFVQCKPLISLSPVSLAG
jgi:hypothetical protein